MCFTFQSTFTTMAISIHWAPTETTCTAELLPALESKNPRRPSELPLTSDRNINIPWPTKGMGDSDYLYAFQQVVMPVAYDFNPDMVISEC